jgi:ABC-type enterobactin transport system permease subunit
VNEDGPVLDEAMENLKEAARLVRATQNRLWSAGKIDHPDYRELTHRLSSALAMTEATYVEARRMSERAE